MNFAAGFKDFGNVLIKILLLFDDIIHIPKTCKDLKLPNLTAAIYNL